MFDKTKKYWYLASNKDESKILNCTFDKAHDRSIFGWNSLSRRFDTKEELIKEDGIPDEPCKICGNIFSTSFMEDMKSRLLEKNICFNCNFWENKISIKDDPRTVRINGVHYHIDDDKSHNTSFLGFGGDEFNIRFNDGRFVTTHNLWCQGDISKHFKDKLPDNAVFVTIQHTERNKVLKKLFPNLP